jgi:hypothetical protein
MPKESYSSGPYMPILASVESDHRLQVEGHIGGNFSSASVERPETGFTEHLLRSTSNLMVYAK